jgi:hypothetical protein
VTVNIFFSSPMAEKRLRLFVVVDGVTVTIIDMSAALVQHHSGFFSVVRLSEDLGSTVVPPFFEAAASSCADNTVAAAGRAYGQYSVSALLSEDCAWPGDVLAASSLHSISPDSCLSLL